MKPLPLGTLVIVLVAVVYTSPALAWVTSSLKSSETTIVVDSSGRAQIAHELQVQVKAGVLQHFELVGVDRDATALKASVARASGGLRSSPSALAVELVGDSLGLHVLPPTKLSRGTFVFALSYAVDVAPERLQFDPVTRTDRAELRWVGPRFADGVDSVRVRFRVPRHDPEPMLPTERPTSDPSGEYDGVFFSTVERSAREDVIELVRPHVARGEPVVWRVWVAPQVVSLKEQVALVSAVPKALAPLPSSAVRQAAGRAPWDSLLFFGVSLGVALGYGALVVFKTWAVVEGARRRGMQARPLLGLGQGARCLLSVASVLSAAALFHSPALAPVGAAALLLAMACAVQLGPRLVSSPRGPGVWRELEFPCGAEALAVGREPRLPGRWLDARQWRGLCAFLLLSSAVLGCSEALFAHRRDEAAILLLSVALWVPVFFSGTRAMFLRTMAQLQASLERIGRSLLSEGYAVAWLSRVPAAALHTDELRLRITPPAAPQGFEGMELGFERFLSSLRVHESVAIVVRAAEGSPCHENFVRTIGAQAVTWERGRRSDQRAAVFRPVMGGVGDAIRLVSIIAHCMSLVQTPPSATRRRSLGSSERMRKPAKCSSPLQAT